jgi:hypothetical protein
MPMRFTINEIEMLGPTPDDQACIFCRHVHSLDWCYWNGLDQPEVKWCDTPVGDSFCGCYYTRSEA